MWGQQIVAERSADGTRIVAISGTAAYDLGLALTAKITKQQALPRSQQACQLCQLLGKPCLLRGQRLHRLLALGRVELTQRATLSSN
ncbi:MULTISPECIES: hypothetical protein [unclassified Bradyrhizobium]|uniref:hypothetical protein n=1 Tax=unclassified Bradyrhizobium TaxID=2631580 RepID=UPI001CD62A97|nr:MULTISPECIES: hypothetical protein [unclassified Bradyrhizobium]MCA1386087.1 hypothetical protein [Bradyrhizobium sp. BRP05]MCA1537895.1 hypothetical protein [Bradyrhizobium sp. NBAIM03]MCA1393885.1 hypothetical protein [Bradyrhizobium sp. IC3123]MCA1423529.1 hypothetical protein [Bradyrhizobium sp. BRP23]MCA1431087.1 hypothetical protein [Bradyrhizobium sp. NBAIM16]